MLDREFIHRIQPSDDPMVETSKHDDWRLKLMICLTGLLYLWGLVLGYDQEGLVILVAILLVVMFWVEFKLDDISWRKHFERRSEYNRNWLCLKCGYDWIDENH